MEGGCPNAYPTGPPSCLAARSRSDLQQLCHVEYTTALWMTKLKANNAPSMVTSLGGGDVWKYIDPTPANAPPSKPDEVSCLPEPHKPAPITKCNLFECYCSRNSGSMLEAEAPATPNATRTTDATPKLVSHDVTPQLVAHGSFVYVPSHQLNVLSLLCCVSTEVRRQVHHRFRRCMLLPFSCTCAGRIPTNGSRNGFKSPTSTSTIRGQGALLSNRDAPTHE